MLSNRISNIAKINPTIVLKKMEIVKETTLLVLTIEFEYF